MTYFRAAILVCAALACGCRHQADGGKTYPEKLSDWDLSGAVPYTVSSPLFSDHADKQRTMCMPPGTKATAAPDGSILFPVGTVLTKTFSYPVNGREKKIETRIVARRDDGWVALPYVWNQEQTEATLVPSGDFTTVSYAGKPFEYAIPNVNQCRTCHDQAGATVPLGPKLRTLDAATLTRLGLRPAPPRWSGIDEKARAYLEANCAHCHNPHGSAAATVALDLSYDQFDLAKLGASQPAMKPFPGAPKMVVRLGAPDESALLSRMKSTDTKAGMPTLGHTLIDEEGVRLIADWIRSLS
jgi:hypothetical protein